MPLSDARRPNQLSARDVFDPNGPALRCAGIGLLQGLAFYGLFELKALHRWPSTIPALFFPMVVVAVLLPVLAALSWGMLRLRTLLVWLCVALALCAFIAWHAIGRELDPGLLAGSATQIFLLLIPLLFVVHCLVEATDVAKQFPPDYPTLFDTSWNVALKLVLANLFVTAFWAILGAGILLFHTLGISSFERVVAQPWFRLPATSLAFAFAIGAAAAQEDLVRGARSVVLSLFGVLLLVLTPIVAAFLIALCFSPLAFLSRTRFACGLLCSVALALILLINAAYQDGGTGERPTSLLRLTALVASVLLMPIVGLAVVSLGLRVSLNGWTGARILLAASLMQGSIYALGYVVSACRPGRWLMGIEGINLAASVSFVLIVGALLTPLADPARLAAASQVARLRDGQVAAAHFDDQFLRFDAARYGIVALRGIVAVPPTRNGGLARRNAQAALALVQPAPKGTPPPDVAALRRRITMHPAGSIVPESLMRDAAARRPDVGSFMMCMTPITYMACDVVVLDSHGGNADRLAVVNEISPLVSIVDLASDGHWHERGNIALDPPCTDERSALLAGRVGTVASTLPDITLAGRRFAVVRRFDTDCGVPFP